MTAQMRGQDLKGDWQWLAFAASLPASPIQFLAVTASQKLATGRFIVGGITGVNTAATAGQVALYDGQDATGPLIGIVDVAATSSFTIPLPANGVMTEIGIYLGVTTATLTGSVSAVPLWIYNKTAPGQ